MSKNDDDMNDGLVSQILNCKSMLENRKPGAIKKTNELIKALEKTNNWVTAGVVKKQLKTYRKNNPNAT